MTGTLVDLDKLTADDLRQLAGLKDGEPARLQSVADEQLRRHLLRLSALMPNGQRQVIQLLLRHHHPAVVLAEHFAAFLVARDLRAALPLEEQGWRYRPQDVMPCDDPDADQATDTASFVHEVARLEREIPDLEQLVAACYDAAAVAGLTPAEAKPLIVAGLRARRTR